VDRCGKEAAEGLQLAGGEGLPSKMSELFGLCCSVMYRLAYRWVSTFSSPPGFPSLPSSTVCIVLRPPHVRRGQVAACVRDWISLSHRSLLAPSYSESLTPPFLPPFISRMLDKVAMHKQGEKSVDGTDSFANAASGKSYCTQELPEHCEHYLNLHLRVHC
jgi:hypothetical protein